MSLQSTSLSQHVQQYIAIDDELQSLQEQQRQLRERKQQVQSQIIKTMKDHKLDHRTMKLGSHQLSIGSRKQYSALSFSYIQSSLEQLIPDKEHRDYVLQYLRDNREVKTVEEIKSSKIK